MNNTELIRLLEIGQIAHEILEKKLIETRIISQNQLPAIIDAFAEIQLLTASEHQGAISAIERSKALNEIMETNIRLALNTEKLFELAKQRNLDIEKAKKFIELGIKVAGILML